MPSEVIAALSPINRRVRAFFAPVNRITGLVTAWDPGTIAAFSPDAPPAPWLDLGWCSHFERHSATRISAITGGAPAVPLAQVRTEIEATVNCNFESWGKLQLALTSGVQQMNVLRLASGAAPNGSGGAAVPAVPLVTGSTATTLNVGTAASQFSAGELVTVDVDYIAQLGFVGSGVSGGYVKTVASDIDYVRRITLNVARITAVSATTLTLAAPLLAGVPTNGMQVSHVAGFCDREGGSFFQEWSALFVLDGEQGDRIVFHYPRLQAMTSAAEANETLNHSTLERLRLAGSFRALPVKDASDGESIVCFRSYLPAALRAI